MPESPFPLPILRRALAGLHARAFDAVPASRKAAVAAIVREAGDDLELLFIRRAEHPNDPWSGHMAFPGGRVETSDRGVLDAAVREVREELRLDLEHHARLLGRLSEVRTHRSARSMPAAVAPFVFELQGDPRPVPNSEVQEVVWVPVSFLAEPSHRGTYVWTGRGIPIPLPCYHFNGRMIWGLTLQMVDELLDVGCREGARSRWRTG